MKYFKDKLDNFMKWKGWHLHPLIILIMVIISGISLAYIFMNGLEESLIAYIIYPFSAYTLLVFIACIIKYAKSVNHFIHNNRFIKPLFEDPNRKFLLATWIDQLLNFGYGVLKTFTGIILNTPILWADGIYNLVQGLLQMFQIFLHRRHLCIEKQWKSYRICAWVILLVHLTMLGPVFSMVFLGEVEEYPGYLIFGTAAFTFYKLISSIIDVAKDRKHKSPVDASIRLLDLTQALFSIFSLQVALLHVFADSTINQPLMNAMTGCIVCLMVMGTGVYMLRRSKRELAKYTIDAKSS